MLKTAAAVAGVLFVCGGTVFAQNRTSASFRNTQDAVRYYEELVGNLARQVKQMQDDNASMNEALQNLKQKVAVLEESNRQIVAQTDLLRKKIAADSEARNIQLNHLAEKLTRQPQTPPPAAKPAPETPRKKPSREKASYEVECYEHVVEAGQTLTAIAKAYHVSVQEIMTFNHLKNANLRVGQKLLIPDKKQ